MATRPLPEQDKRDWLRLIRSTHLGPITFHHILRYYGSATEAIARLPEIAARGGSKRKIELASEKTIAAELKALKACGAQLLAWGEPVEEATILENQGEFPTMTDQGEQEVPKKRKPTASKRRPKIAKPAPAARHRPM